MPLTNDQLGELAEAEFKRWTAQAGLVANKAQQDRTGWDFLVEIPDIETTLPADVHGPWQTAKVQVKGVHSHVERKSVKLDNWAHAVRDLTPFFFVVVVIDDSVHESPQVTAAFLAHVDEARCSHVLKRLRDQTDDSPALHEQTVDLVWRPNEELAHEPAPSLVQRLRTTIGHPHKYMSEKLRWFQTAGYQEEPVRVKISPLSGELDVVLGMVADFAIGLRRRLPIRSMEVIDERFDSPRSIAPFQGAVPDYIEMSGLRPNLKVRLDLGLLDHSDEMSLQCDAYVSTLIFPQLPPEYLKIRCVAGPVEFVFEKDAGMHFFFAGVSQAAQPIRELWQTAKSVRLIARGMPVGVVTQLHIYEDAPPYRLEFSGDALQIVPELQDWAEVMEAAGDVASALGIESETIVEPTALLAQASALRLLRDALRPGQDTIRVVVTFQEVEEQSEWIAFCDTVPVRFGDVGVLCLVVMEGRATWVRKGDDLEATVSGCRPNVYQKWRAAPQELQRIDTHQAEVRLNAELDRRGVGTIVTDFLHRGAKRPHPAFVGRPRAPKDGCE